MRRTPGVRAAATTTSAAITAAFACIALAGCASVTAGGDAADPDAIARLSSSSGIAPELVYTTAVDGYDLAPQSVGPSNADGLQATWVNNATAAMLTIRSDRGELTEASCVATPLWDAPDAVTCTEEDGIWHRSGGDVHEYVAVRDGALIWVIGSNDAPESDLLAAAKAVHVPSDAELQLLFSDAPEVPTEPVERGDIPENGDGAPVDPVGPGG